MKSITSKTVAFVAICVTLFSFSPKPGGEGFEISLNNKVVLQQFGSQMDAVKSMSLNQGSYNDQLTIKYHHCGKVGKNRVVTIKDGQNKILKEWHFADASTPVAAMAINVKDILALQKGNSRVNLYYSSSELPKGRLLTTITPGNITGAKP